MARTSIDGISVLRGRHVAPVRPLIVPARTATARVATISVSEESTSHHASHERHVAPETVSPRILHNALVACAMVVLAGAGVLGYQTWHTNVEAKEIYSRPVVRDQGVPNSGAEGTDERPVTESQKKEYVVAPDMPRTMRIPSIGVDARVLRMGINDEGAVESPYNIWDTGWYDGSAKPGEKGNAFINGHISGPTEPAVFSKLKDVKVGAEVVVERGDGSLLTYRVISNQTKRLDDIRMNDVLALPIGSDEVLSIMTCGGDYLGNYTYDSRVIVYAERVR